MNKIKEEYPNLFLPYKFSFESILSDDKINPNKKPFLECLITFLYVYKELLNNELLHGFFDLE